MFPFWKPSVIALCRGLLVSQEVMCEEESREEEEVGESDDCHDIFQLSQLNRIALTKVHLPIPPMPAEYKYRYEWRVLLENTTYYK